MWARACFDKAINNEVCCCVVAILRKHHRPVEVCRQTPFSMKDGNFWQTFFTFEIGLGFVCFNYDLQAKHVFISIFASAEAQYCQKHREGVLQLYARMIH